MTAVLDLHKPASLIAWMQYALQMAPPTSTESDHDRRRPTDWRSAPPSTNDLQGSAHNATARPAGATRLGQTPWNELRPEAAALARRATADDDPDYALAAMAEAAAAQDESGFLAAIRLVDWRLADVTTYEQAVRLALAAGAHMAARQLAAQGAALHPASAYLPQAAHVLAPPAAVARRPASNTGNVANKAWLVANRTAYHGQWVALRSGELLASAARLQDLIDHFGARPEILYTRVT